MSLKIHLLKAFTQNPAEGNPAGVLLDAEGLSEAAMLKIAADLGFSESAFVFPSEKADFRVRFFTGQEEVNLCGHATLATVHALQEAGRVPKIGKVVQETKVGLLELECFEDGRIVMTQAEPEFLELEVDREVVARLLGLTVSDLGDWPIRLVSTGTPKLMIPIKSLATVLAIRPDLEGIKDFCRETGAKGFYPFTAETRDEADFHARQFNPLAGINEDPITGVAAGALGAYLREFGLSDKREFVVEQGFSMGKPGRIFVDVQGKVKVGGYAVSFGELSVEL